MVLGLLDGALDIEGESDGWLVGDSVGAAVVGLADGDFEGLAEG